MAETLTKCVKRLLSGVCNVLLLNKNLRRVQNESEEAISDIHSLSAMDFYGSSSGFRAQDGHRARQVYGPARRKGGTLLDIHGDHRDSGIF
jgi:hypothetical protein